MFRAHRGARISYGIARRASTRRALLDSVASEMATNHQDTPVEVEFSTLQPLSEDVGLPMGCDAGEGDDGVDGVGPTGAGAWVNVGSVPVASGGSVPVSDEEPESLGGVLVDTSSDVDGAELAGPDDSPTDTHAPARQIWSSAQPASSVSPLQSLSMTSHASIAAGFTAAERSSQSSALATYGSPSTHEVELRDGSP